MHSVHRRRQGGYSLIEVLTATAILAAVLAIGIPNFVNLRTPYAADSAAHQIAADCHDARMRAIARNVRYRLNIDTTAGTWVVQRETAPGSGTFVADSRMQQLPKGADFVSVAPSNPEFTSQGMVVTPVTIMVRSTGHGTYSGKTVTINALGQTTIS